MTRLLETTAHRDEVSDTHQPEQKTFQFHTSSVVKISHTHTHTHTHSHSPLHRFPDYFRYLGMGSGDKTPELSLSLHIQFQGEFHLSKEFLIQSQNMPTDCRCFIVFFIADSEGDHGVICKHQQTASQRRSEVREREWTL